MRISDWSSDVCSSDLFANRNHFALFLAMGCLIAPVWAFAGKQNARWRAPVALALMTLFALIILATGSRAGILTGLLAMALGLALCWHNVRRALHRPEKRRGGEECGRRGGYGWGPEH